MVWRKNMNFCRSCHEQLPEGVTGRCDKCITNPLRSIVKSYGSEEDEIRMKLMEIDHDCRHPDPCTICYKIQEADRYELKELWEKITMSKYKE